MLSKYYNCEFDDRGNIGKRYRRQDEIGTPFCVTYDFDSEEDGAVTVRDRDTMQQERIKIMEASADIIFAFRGSSEWFAQPGLEEILFLARPMNGIG